MSTQAITSYIDVEVHGKELSVPADACIVCNNSCYVLRFNFDAEWEGHNIKTVRFVFTVGRETSDPLDVVFTGNEVKIPIMQGIELVYIGVYAGDIHSTLKAPIPCKKSILCDMPPVPPPTPSCYEQILALFENVHGASVWVRFSEHADGTNFTETWTEGQNYIGFATALTPPTDKRAYTWTYVTSGPKGDSAYVIAKNNGFRGTEREWLETLSGVYVGEGEMPDGYYVQIDPSGDDIIGDISKSLADILAIQEELIGGKS